MTHICCAAKQQQCVRWCQVSTLCHVMQIGHGLVLKEEKRNFWSAEHHLGQAAGGKPEKHAPWPSVELGPVEAHIANDCTVSSINVLE